MAKLGWIKRMIFTVSVIGITAAASVTAFAGGDFFLDRDVDGNMAYGKPTSTNPGGNTNTGVINDGFYHQPWTSSSSLSTSGQYITIDLGKDYYFNRCWIMTGSNTYGVSPSKSYAVEVKAPNGYWSRIFTLTNNTNNFTANEFNELYGRYVRILFFEGNTSGRANLFEFSIYHTDIQTLSTQELFEQGNQYQAYYPNPGVDIAKPLVIVGSNWGGETTKISSTVLQVSLKGAKYFDRWLAKKTDGSNLPRHFRLLTSVDGTNFYGTDKMKFYTSSSFARSIPQTAAKYIRFISLDGTTVDNVKLELYNDAGYVAMPGDILLTHDSDPDHSGIAYDSTRSVEAHGGPGIHWDNISKWKTGSEVRVKRIKNATLAMAKGAAEYAKSKIGYSYNYNVFDYKSTSSFYCNSLVYHSWRSGSVPGVDLDDEYYMGYLSANDLDEDSSTYTIWENGW